MLKDSTYKEFTEYVILFLEKNKLTKDDTLSILYSNLISFLVNINVGQEYTNELFDFLKEEFKRVSEIIRENE